MKKEKNNLEENSKNEKEKVQASCTDRDCHIHGYLKTHGRSFKGYVIKKLPRRVTIEFERIISVKKYERYYVTKSKIHARLPDCMKSQIEVGDYIEVMECRPLSKILHFVVVKKIKSAGEK